MAFAYDGCRVSLLATGILSSFLCYVLAFDETPTELRAFLFSCFGWAFVWDFLPGISLSIRFLVDHAFGGAEKKN